MQSLKKFAAAGLIAVSAAMAGTSAGAFSISVINSSPQNGDANNADVFAPNFGAFVPVGASWTGNINVRNTSTSEFKSPWVNTPLSGKEYYSVQKNQSATLTFTTAQSSFRFLLGSVDDYNFFTFSNGTDSAVVDGTAIAAAIGSPSCGSAANFECVADVKISGFSFGAFDSITFESRGANAVEFATIPLPAAAWLLLAASGGLIAAKRRSARRSA
jgi:hypothetical protein